MLALTCLKLGVRRCPSADVDVSSRDLTDMPMSEPRSWRTSSGEQSDPYVTAGDWLGLTPRTAPEDHRLIATFGDKVMTLNTPLSKAQRSETPPP